MLIQFHYHAQSPRKRTNFPFAFHGITAHNDLGEEIGYLTIEHVTQAFVQTMEDNPFLYLAAFLNDSSMFSKYRTLRLDETPPQLDLQKTLHYMEKKQLIPLNQHAEATDEKLEALFPKWCDLLKQSTEFKIKWDQNLEYHFEKPMVHYIKVHPDYRGQGIGLELYKQAALAMKNMGVELYSSTTQSKAAQLCWEKMMNLGWVDEVILKLNAPYGKDRRYKINAAKLEPQLSLKKSRLKV